MAPPLQPNKPGGFVVGQRLFQLGILALIAGRAFAAPAISDNARDHFKKFKENMVRRAGTPAELLISFELSRLLATGGNPPVTALSNGAPELVAKMKKALKLEEKTILKAKNVVEYLDMLRADRSKADRKNALLTPAEESQLVMLLRADAEQPDEKKKESPKDLMEGLRAIVKSELQK